MTAALDRWRYRRRLVMGTVAFCALVILGLAAFGDDESTLQKTIAEMLGWGAFGVIGVYIGAPVADDWLQKGK